MGLLQRREICLNDSLNLSQALVEIYVVTSYNYTAFGKRYTGVWQGRVVWSNMTPSGRQFSQQKQKKDISAGEIIREGICKKINKTWSCFVEMEAVTKDNKHLVVPIIC